MIKLIRTFAMRLKCVVNRVLGDRTLTVGNRASSVPCALTVLQVSLVPQRYMMHFSYYNEYKSFKVSKEKS